MADKIGTPQDISVFGVDEELKAGLISTFGYIDWSPPDEIHIPDHVKRTLDLLIEQFEKKAGMVGLIESDVKQMQNIEDIGVDIYSLRRIDTAGGYTLDMVGEIVGVYREGKDDTTFRLHIYMGILTNKGNGEPNLLIDALKLYTNGEIVYFSEVYPATAQLFVLNNGTIDNGIALKMQKLAPAGVEIITTYSEKDIYHVLCTGVEGGVEPPPEGGCFSELGYTGSDIDYIPGRIAELISK